MYSVCVCCLYPLPLVAKNKTEHISDCKKSLCLFLSLHAVIDCWKATRSLVDLSGHVAMLTNQQHRSIGVASGLQPIRQQRFRLVKPGM